MYKILCLAICLMTYMPVMAYPATVSKVIDGDTVVLTSGEHIRLAGIDCPEHDQPYGQEAKQETTYLCHSCNLDIEEISHDRYGRTIAWIHIVQHDDYNHDFSTCSVNSILVFDGLAWHYTKYDHNPELDCAQADAQHNHRGLWQDPNPVPPWEWRHNK